MKNLSQNISVATAAICLFIFSSSAVLAQKDTPCEGAQRWTRGGHWNNDGTVNDAGNAPNPLGIIRCGSSAETMSNIKANGSVYNASQFEIIAAGCKNPDTGLPANVNPPTSGCPVIWINFDQRPAAGSYQYQIVSSDAYSWALYYSPEHQKGVDANGLSGDCSNLAYYACGNSFSGWATFTTPSFLPATNLYIAVWKTTGCGTQNGFSISLKARYGCGDADLVLCNVESGNTTVSCNADNTYSVNIPINGVNGNYQGYDPNATPTTSNIVTLKNIGSGGPISGTITMTYPQSVSTYNVVIDDVIIGSGDIIPSNPDSCSFNVTGNGLNCDDGDPSSVDACDGGVCTHTCDDGNACTQDSYVNGSCVFSGGDCNDNDPCTQDICNPATGCSHTNGCDDGNPQSVDACVNGVCTHTCDDDNACTQDSYVNGNCVFSGGDCNDNNACTQDICNPATGCSHSGNCADEDPASTDACVNGVCTHTCNDGNACTQDSYVNGNCVFSGGSCNDNNACTQNICNPATGCSNPPINCDDGNPNTNDYCSDGTCVHTTCNDNNPCTTDILVNGNCVFTSINCDDGNPQSADDCVNGVCSHTCNDGNGCTSDSYSNGNCVFTPNDCSDNNVCTADNCVNGNCQHPPFCNDDNNACTNNYCRISNQVPVCIFSSIDCSDDISCTIDACNPANGNCGHDDSGCTSSLICPPKMIIVLDESGSIAGFGQGSVGVTAQVRNGVAGMFTALSETDIDVAVVEFNTRARRAVINGTTAYQQITPANLNSFLAYVNDNNTTPESNHFDPEDYLGNTSTAFTNWDDALKLVQTINANEGLAPLVLFFTDGKPTAYNNANGTVTQGTGSATVAEALSRAVASANAVKGQGAHIFAVAFPNPSLTEAYVQAISGTQRYPSPEPDFTKADYSIESSTSLENSLKAIAGLLCRADLRLSITVNPAAACPGNTVVFKVKVTNDGLDRADIVQVKDYLPSGYTYVSDNKGSASTFASGIVTWSVGTLLNTKSDSILITAVINQSGDFRNVAEVTSSNKDDGDSQPGNFSTNPDEDDEAAVSVSFQGCNGGGGCTSNSQCNDANSCTADACSGGVCQNTTIDCNDSDACTTDGCNPASGCTHTPVVNCNTNDPCAGVNCDDGNPCTADACAQGSCTHTAVQNQPSYLKIVNQAKSWRKLKLGYSSTNLYSPLQNVTAGGNNQMCITLRAAGTPEWNKIQIRPQGGSAAAVTLSNYINGSVANFTTFCIPLSAFTGYNFSSISYMETPYSNGANPFEIHISKIEFTGGSTPFLWFGDPHTNNIHDGQSGSSSALTATLVPGSPCGSAKMMSDDTAENTFISAYPNPFNNELNFEFSITGGSEVSLELFSITGAKIATIFEGKVEGSVLYKETFHPGNLSSGFYIYKLKTAVSVITEKVLMTH